MSTKSKIKISYTCLAFHKIFNYKKDQYIILDITNILHVDYRETIYAYDDQINRLFYEHFTCRLS